MLEAYQTLMDVLNDSEEAIADMRESGYKLAMAKREYGIALASKMLSLRMTDGLPVTLIPDVARGEEQVAQLRFLRDAAKSEWEADRYNCERLRNTAWIIQRQIEMEARGR